MSKYNYFKGIYFIAGTCIGAGMIGLPVKTAAAGFYPTVCALFLVWLIMTGSGLLLLEASLSFSGEKNFISMTHAIFGNSGKNIAWCICILFLYAVMAAFSSGGAGLLIELCSFFKVILNPKLATLIFMLPFIVIVYAGTKWVAIVNKILTITVIIFFILLCISMFNTQQVLQPITNLSVSSDLTVLFNALPLIVTTFSYHEIIPSLKSYLQEEVISLKVAILLGGFIPLIVYIIWEVVVLLLVPISGPQGLISMLASNKNPSDSLIEYLLVNGHHTNILLLIVCFSFSALTCSLTGTAWALCDFFADGLRIKKNKSGKIILSLLTFMPAIIYPIVCPQGFLQALSFAGAFSAIIMIVYPALMVYKIRSKKNIAKSSIIYKVPINKLLISMIFLFGILVFILEIINNVGQ